MGKLIDLTGKRFGRLTVLERDLEFAKTRLSKSPFWKCICDCGNIKSIEGTCLREGRTKSCGCLNLELVKSRPNAGKIDLIGKTFNHLTVIDRSENDHRGETRWVCKCDCGNPIPLIVLSSNLRSDHTRSCGCVRYSKGEEKVIRLLKENNLSFFYNFSFPDLLSNKQTQLYFDFFINQEYLIEYDGETHYRYNLHGWHNEEQLMNQKERDEIKNKYCLLHSIPLIRIPYTHYNFLSIDDLLVNTTKFLVKEDNYGK